MKMLRGMGLRGLKRRICLSGRASFLGFSIVFRYVVMKKAGFRAEDLILTPKIGSFKG